MDSNAGIPRGNMKHTAVHICSFQSAPTVRKRTRYADLKKAVLEAGRFSVFEATENQYAAKLFDRLCKDPELETFPIHYPWTGVRKRAVT